MNAIKELETIVLLYDSNDNDIDSIRKALEACIISCSNNDNDSSKLIALLLPYYLNHNNSNNSSSNTIDSIISSNIDSISVCYPCTISFTITIMIKAIVQYDLTMKSTSSSSTHYHNTCIRKLISITKLLVRLINIINHYNGNNDDNDATICIYKKALDEMWLLQNSNIDSSIISSRVFIIITLIVVIHMSSNNNNNNNNNNSSSSSSSSSSSGSSSSSSKRSISSTQTNIFSGFRSRCTIFLL